jgi:hypothetical protein
MNFVVGKSLQASQRLIAHFEYEFIFKMSVLEAVRVPGNLFEAAPASEDLVEVPAVALHFVPFHFVPGHFVPVISSPHTFRPQSFCPQSFRPLVISSPRAESTEVHA